MKTLVMFVLMMVLYAQPAQAAQAQADVTYFEFSSASYGYETVLPAVQLQPGLYVYLFKQTAGQLGIDFYPDIQVIANPPQCAAVWNEHPFGARGQFTGTFLTRARGLDLFPVAVDCTLTISIHSNKIRAYWHLAIAKLADWSDLYLDYLQ